MTPGERRIDHRAYAVGRPRQGCGAAPWRACVSPKGASLTKPHRERKDAEKGARGGKGTTAADRTPTLGTSFEDPTVRVVARVLGAGEDPNGGQDA